MSSLDVFGIRYPHLCPHQEVVNYSGCLRARTEIHAPHGGPQGLALRPKTRNIRHWDIFGITCVTSRALDRNTVHAPSKVHNQEQANPLC